MLISVTREVIDFFPHLSMNNFMNTLMIPVYFSSEYICTYIFPIFYHGKVVSVSIIYYKVPNLDRNLAMLDCGNNLPKCI